MGTPVHLPVIAGVVLALASIEVTGQGDFPPSQPVDLPDGPAKPGFDIDRFSNAGNGWFETFYVEQTRPLRAVLDAGEVVADTPVLVLETAGGTLALLTDQMGYHHLAQGRAAGKDWMATF